MNTGLYFIPFISAFIGWATNCLAVRMLFRPHRKTKIAGIDFQGLIPKRKPEIAHNIGETVNKNLVSVEDITTIVENVNFKDEINAAVDEIVESKLKEKVIEMMPIAAAFIDNFIDPLKQILESELSAQVPKLTGRIISDMETKIDFHKIVEERINSFETEKLETIILDIARKELKGIELLGGVIGFAVGLVQIAIISFL